MRLPCVVHHEMTGGGMRVQRVVLPGSGAESWTLLGDDGCPVEPAARFVAWLRLPPRGRGGAVIVLPAADHHCGPASVNRKLAALTSFCEFHARHGIGL